MRTLFAAILLNLILIPALWLLPYGKVMAYTVFGIVDAVFYFLFLFFFLYRYRDCRDEEKAGRTLPFVLIQLFLPASLFLLKLSEYLLLHNFE